MKFSKICLSIILCLFLIFSSCEEVNALFGNTHYNIGKQIINKIYNTLPENNKTAFLSGIVYADIGKFKWDKETGIDSDSPPFLEKIKKHITTTEEEWFVRGIEMHILQDKKTGELLKNIFEQKSDDYINYMIHCGLLDYYFLNKNNSYIYNEFLDKFNFEQVILGVDIKTLSKKINISEDKVKLTCSSILKNYYKSIYKNQLIMYDDLIIKTYNSLGIEITNKDIHEQEANILGAFAVTCSMAGKQKISKPLADKIDFECEKMADLCILSLCES